MTASWVLFCLFAFVEFWPVSFIIVLNSDNGRNNQMTNNEYVIENLKKAVASIASEYSIKKATLFGSRAAGTNDENSDIDLLVEFFAPISLLTLSGLKLSLEEKCKLKVDVIHAPIPEGSILDIGEEVSIYES